MKSMYLVLVVLVVLSVITGYVLSVSMSTTELDTGSNDGSWRIRVDVSPRKPSVGSLVRIYVNLVYTGSKEIRVNPFVLRTKYVANLTIINLDKKTVYLTKSIGYKEGDPGEKTIVVKPGDTIGLGYVEIVFIEPGHYSIKAHITGPKLADNNAETMVEIEPKTINIGNEVISKSNDWVLRVKVEPKEPTVKDDLIIYVSLEYIGNEEFKAKASILLIKTVKIIHVKGIDSWSIVVPSHISLIKIKPGYKEDFKFVIGPKA